MLGDSVRRRQPAGAKKRAKPKPKLKPIRWRVVVPATLAALVIPFVVGYAVAVYVLFPPAEASGTGVSVPSLTGRSLSEAAQLLSAAGLGTADTISLPHPDAPRGRILAQDPLPGQQLMPGADVRVSVSAGPPSLLVPDVEGFTAGAAEQLLRRLGFETRRVEERDFSAPGRVLRLEPSQGTRLQLPSTVTIVVSSGPGVTAPAAPVPTPDDIMTDTVGDG